MADQPTTPPTDTAPEPRPRRAGFRDDIQGMRALAVLAIMVFHAGLSPYPGGFVTLDVFFVVSGFLITFLLLREIDRDGTVSLTRFYARRARRILPAATVVTLAVLGASALWLDVVAARDAAVDALWAAFFAANVRFAVQETDYFAEDAAVSPFQHYWSLAVEEQFYLVLPLLMVACVVLALRLARRGRHLGLGSPRRMVGVAVALMTLASFAWSVHASFASPATAYFSTFTRTWEFGVGALLALAAPAAARLPAAARNLLAGGGLLAIAVACFVVTEATPFPGYAALLPVLGTGAVMVAGAGVTGRPPTVQRALGVAPLRLVGDMSYSLYLWHWPMLTIAAAYAGRDLRLTETAVVLGLCVALSWATYRWVETPFRTYAPRRLSRTLVLYPVSLAVVLAGSGVATAWVGDGVDTRGDAITTREWDRAPGDRPLSDDETVALVQASVVAARQGAEIPRRLDPPLVDLAAQRAAVGTCDYEDAPPWTLCRRGDVGADRSIVVLGNSHGRHWIPAVERIAQQEGFETHYLTKQACTPARVQSISRDSERPWRECTQFNAWAQEQVERLEPDIVIAVGSAPRGLFVDGELVKDTDERTEEMGRGFSRLIADLEPHAGEVVILGDVPRRDDQPGECLGRPRASLARCLATPDARAAGVVEVSREATVGTTARFIDTEPWFCADGRCPAVVGDMITMRDQGHVTNVYSAHLADALARALGVRGRR